MENGAERGLRERFDDHHQAAGETRLCGRGCCGDPVECRMPILRGLGLLHFFFPCSVAAGWKVLGCWRVESIDAGRPPAMMDMDMAAVRWEGSLHGGPTRAPLAPRKGQGRAEWTGPARPDQRIILGRRGAGTRASICQRGRDLATRPGARRGRGKQAAYVMRFD